MSDDLGQTTLREQFRSNLVSKKELAGRETQRCSVVVLTYTALGES